MADNTESNRNKTETVKARCTPIQRDELLAFSEETGMSISELWWACFTDYRARYEERKAKQQGKLKK